MRTILVVVVFMVISALLVEARLGPDASTPDTPSLASGSTQEALAADPQVYLVPYMGDVDGGLDPSYFPFFDFLRQWHDENGIPLALTFYPNNMGHPEYNRILADMYLSQTFELVPKGLDAVGGTPIELLPYDEAKAAIGGWVNNYIVQLQAQGIPTVRYPAAYNQLFGRFTPTIRDAVHDLGFKMYFEQYVSELGFVDPLPDFDVMQYSVSMTVSGLPGPNEPFKDFDTVYNEILNFTHERLLTINGVPVVSLLTHQQDYRIAEGSPEINWDKFGLYAGVLVSAKNDPRIRFIKPEEIYSLRHPPACGNGICGINETASSCPADCAGTVRRTLLTDFETPSGWLAEGLGPGRFEVGEPHAFLENGGECASECFGIGVEGDHSEIGTQAACTNLDGHQQPFDSEATNSLLSPEFDLSNHSNVTLKLWRFMEIEGSNFDLCYFQYRTGAAAPWATFETYGASPVDDDAWTAYERFLGPLADHQADFQLRFYCTTDAWFEGSGLCLDDVELSGVVPAQVCGNGLVEGSEGCDDGNVVSGDGCSSSCHREPPVRRRKQVHYLAP